MEQFSGARKKLMKSILIPLTAMLFLVFIVIYTTITTIGFANYQASVKNAIERKVDSFNLTLSLQVSSNSTITKSLDVIAYAQGDNEHESSVRGLLSQKLSQSPNLLGNQIYFIDDLVEQISSYSVSGIPTSYEITSLEVVSQFLNQEEDYRFTIRHEFIANTYNFTQYPKQYGIATLFEKIYDDNHNVIALLASDYSSQKLYDEVFDFAYHASLNDAEIQIKSTAGFLKLTAATTEIEGEFREPVNAQGLLTNIYRYDLSPEVFVLIKLSLQKPLTTNILFFVIFLLTMLIIDIFTFYLIRSSVRKIIDPIEVINQNIKDVLE